VSPTTLLLLLLHAQLGLEAAVKHRRYYNDNYSDNDNSSSRRTMTTTTPGVASAAGAFVFRDCGAYCAIERWRAVRQRCGLVASSVRENVCND